MPIPRKHRNFYYKAVLYRTSINSILFFFVFLKNHMSVCHIVLDLCLRVHASLTNTYQSNILQPIKDVLRTSSFYKYSYLLSSKSCYLMVYNLLCIFLNKKKYAIVMNKENNHEKYLSAFILRRE